MKIQKILTMIMTAVMLAAFTACGDNDGSGYTFKMNISSNPENLDPQLATDEASLIVIENMFDGLVRKSASGSIIPAAAEKYTVSDDLLTYTFELRRDISWQSVTKYKAAMKADDFVFAFQRIFDPSALYSPYIDDFSCIKNSYAVKNGKADISDLGVKAEGEFTLVFTLENPCWNFLDKLTETAAMPCNRLFFESTKGRYGLSAENTASNGAFYLKEWNYDPYWTDNYIIMRRNANNSAENYVYPYSINFFISDDSTDDVTDYSKGSTDCLISDSRNEKLFSKNAVSAYEDKSYGLIFNLNSELFKDKDVRKALAYSVNRGQLTGAENVGLYPAGGIIPSAVCMLGKSYRGIVPDNTLYSYDLRLAKSLLGGKAEDFGRVGILVSESFSGAEYINSITAQWGSELDFFCKTDVVSLSEYEMSMKSGDFDIALVEITAEKNSPQSFFSFFTDSFAAEICGYSNNRLNSVVYEASEALNLSSAAEKYSEAEKLIIDDYAYIPLFYGNTYLVSGDKTADLIYYPFERAVYFRNGKSFS